MLKRNSFFVLLPCLLLWVSSMEQSSRPLTADHLFAELPVTNAVYRLMTESNEEARARVIAEIAEAGLPIAVLSILEGVVELSDRESVVIAGEETLGPQLRVRAAEAILGILQLEQPPGRDVCLRTIVAAYRRALLEQSALTRGSRGQVDVAGVDGRITLERFNKLCAEWPPLGAPAEDLARILDVKPNEDGSILVQVMLGERARRCAFAVEDGVVTNLFVMFGH